MRFKSMEGVGRNARSALIVGLCLAGFAHSAVAQSYVKPPCPSGVAPRFEDHLQSLWYRRFWTGDCKGLPAMGCRKGQPYWNSVVNKLKARAPENQRAAVSTRACKLGRQIGFEWTRPKKVRRIDTQELQKLNAALEQAPDVSAGLAAVETRVRVRLGS
ncbi:hypothetical protein [Phenylobacterium ferrooxidans]|uniref:Uncharacterized protein n=1 Tax=Phenylobacterium ferrooxidans TaxID=2982689 RepID=A0ABW6CMQ5_9CAUL